MILNSINWYDPKSHVTDHFTVHDCVYLPSWGVYHVASDTERVALLDLCVRMERVRTFLAGKPINVHCMIRPNKVNSPASPKHGMDYNHAVGSTATHSPHIMGMAIDFDSMSYSCDEIRRLLTPEVLERLGLCMEDAPGTTWVHLDTYAPRGGKRVFKP